MGLFGGGNSSTSNYSSTENTTKTAADYSQLDGGAIQSKIQVDTRDAQNLTINALDGGAIKGSFDFAAVAADTQKEAFAQIGMAGQRETEAAMFALQAAKPADVQTSGDLIKYAAYVAIAIAVVYFMSKGGE